MVDPLVVACMAFGLVLVLILIGFPIGIALGLVGVVGCFVAQGSASILAMTPFKAMDSFVLTALPLFIFMGQIFLVSGASEMVYKGASQVLSWAPGGLLLSNIGASALFAAISGSSSATAATITTVALPPLEKRGYDTRLTLGSLLAGGGLGILIPPSITMIVYGAVGEVSIGQLFAGGVIPGIMLAMLYMSYIATRAVINPRLAPREEVFSVKALLPAFGNFWPVMVLMSVVLGGIFGGVFTPTEAAAIGCTTVIVIGLMMRRITWRNMKDSLLKGLEISCMILFIIMAASLFSSFLAIFAVPAAFADFIAGLELSRIVVLLFIYLLYLFLGCFVDATSMMVMTIPTILPVIIALGFSPVWFGVVLILLCEMGQMTPPMGTLLYIVKSISGKRLEEVLAGVAPFFGILVFGLAVLTAFPRIILWLPSVTVGK
ncbi:C4-dicarboxylate TRAP transporter large permease protein DctM [subsurface metagenome]